MNFTQTSSIVRRFRFIIIGLGLLLILEFVGIFASSQTLLVGLKDLSQINELTDLASRGVLNLNFTLETLDKARSSPTSTPKQLIPIYEAAELQASNAIDSALKLNPSSPEVRRLFTDAKNSAEGLNRVAQKIFLDLPALTPAQQKSLNKNLLLIKQFDLDASESLRGAQIELTRSGSETFSRIYRGRMTPLLVSFGLALGFFTVALFIGLSTTKRLNSSLSNLLRATEEVAQGNLSIQLPMIAHDEIGRLTAAFDSMVKNLDKSLKNAKASAERTSRLQAITAEFSRALDLKSVAKAVLFHGIDELGANAGTVCTLSEDGDFLDLITSYGYSSELMEKYRRFPLSSDLPSAVSVRQQKSFFIESGKDFLSQFAIGSESSQCTPLALAVVPLIVGGTPMGAIAFSFQKEKTFTQEERNFVVTLADLASQSFQRASLYTSAQKAIHVRDEFLSIASHELKTPITSLKMQLQLAQRQTKPDENIAPSPQKLARVFQSSVSQIDRLTSLVEDLLDVSRMEAGKLSLNFAVFDLRENLKNVLERFEGVLQAAHCPAELIQADSAWIRGDAFRMEQVLINLLSNAMKYGGAKPIQISLIRNAPHTVQLSVQDHGMGVPIEKQAIIFDRFERVSTSHKIGGLGLGLYIARQIVEAHQGKIDLTSVVGEGSTFTLELPTVEPIQSV